MSFNPYSEWEEYQTIEEGFLRYLRNVPLTEAHYNVWSFPLSNFLINIGSLIDSFFKNIAFEDSLNAAPGITNLRGTGRPDMGDYREVFERYYQLSKSTVYELRNHSALIPFADWNTDDDRKATTLKWWKAYTDLKHDRFLNKEEATLKNTLDALGALFLLNVKSFETIKVLLDYQIINREYYSLTDVKRVLSQREPLNISAAPIYVKTGLFGYVYENLNFPDSDKSKKEILSPSYPGY